MSKNKSVMYGLIGGTSFVLLTMLVISSNGQSQQGQSSTQGVQVLRRGNPTGNEAYTQPTAKELDDAATPIVDFDNSSNAEANVGEVRKLKNAQYDKNKFVHSQPHPRAGETVSDSQWHAGLSDLPADKCDVVVEGEVINSKAYLSNDKTGVYSEFTLNISRVLRAAPGVLINEGATTVIERTGGRVRYPSGQIVRYREEGQGSPVRGKKYLFFLTRLKQGDYKILTGYELQSDKVFALDGSRSNPRGRGDWVFDKNNGKELVEFLEAVESALHGSPTSKQIKEVGQR